MWLVLLVLAIVAVLVASSTAYAAPAPSGAAHATAAPTEGAGSAGANDDLDAILAELFPDTTDDSAGAVTPNDAAGTADDAWLDDALVDETRLDPAALDLLDALDAGEPPADPIDRHGRPSRFGRLELSLAWRHTDRARAMERSIADDPVRTADELWLLATWRN